DETGFARYILELVAAHVPIQNARLGAFGMEMAHECVAESNEVAAGPTLIAGVDTDVGHEQIEPPIPVVVEENRSRRMTGIGDAGSLGDVAESAAALILEQVIAVAHRRHEQIGIAVV